MTNYLELPVGAESPDVINAVIEIPHEGINKYEYDKKLHVLISIRRSITQVTMDSFPARWLTMATRLTRLFLWTRPVFLAA